MWQQTAYLKASNTEGGDLFSGYLSLNANGDTLAVGAMLEDSVASSIDGNQNDNSASGAGAVYVFALNNRGWEQQAYLKAGYNSTEWQGLFGSAISLSDDGNTLAVGALTGQTLIDVGAAQRVLEPSRASALENVLWLLASSAILALVLVTEDAFAIHVHEAGQGELLARGTVHQLLLREER